MEINLNIKVTKEQKEIIKQKAKEQGLSVSAYLRMKALS